MLAELKRVLRETTYDAAWGDTLLEAYLAEGQDKFCEDTGYFVDHTNYTVTTVVGQADYELDERIIQVMEVWNGTTRLGKFQQSDLGYNRANAWNALDNPVETSDSYCWQSDLETGVLTLYPTPTTVRTLNLRVWRYARRPLNTSYMNDDDPPVSVSVEPEIPKRFRRAPIHWAAFRALSHHDMEQQDKIKASDNLAIYTNIKNEGRTAFERTMGRRVSVSPDPCYVGV